MKKLFYILTSAALFLSCETKNVTIESAEYMIEGRSFHVYIIDSCEYIGKISNSKSDCFSHKGNCKFCAERNKKN